MLYALLCWVALHGGIIQEGYAPHYAPRLMARVAHNRGLAPVPCMVSRPTGPLGGWVWVYGVNTHAIRRCKIVDVSHPRDLARHIRLKRVTELSYEVTRALCGSTNERSSDCPVMVIQ